MPGRIGNAVWGWAAVFCIVGLLLPSPAVAQGRRLAFVIGNAQYANETQLANPLNDARLIAGVLRNDLHFDEVFELRNLGRASFFDLVTEISQRSRGADAVVVYYSGHGMRGLGSNYLIPVDARITEEAHLRRDAVSASDLVDALQAANPRVAVLILDACRDSPYSRRARSTAKGLARMNVAGGNLLVAYATTDGTTADDGAGSNSPYARALAQHLRNSAMPVMAQFDAVRRTTRELTGNQQNPTREGDLETTIFLLGQPTAPAMDDEAWALCRASQSGRACRDYLAAFSNGRFAALAQTRLRDIDDAARPAAPAASPAPPPAPSRQEQVAIAPATLPAATVATPRLEKVSYAADFFFNFGDSQMHVSADRKLQELAEKSRGIALEVLIAVGHADAVEANPQKLSLARAEALKAALVATHGIAANRIYIEGKGATSPIADNSTAEGRAKNRRVEVEAVGTRSRQP